MRWVIKVFLYFGFWSVLLCGDLGGASRRIVFLFGDAGPRG